MKKIAVLLALLMSLALSCVAEDIDLKAMTDEEISLLIERLQEESSRRGMTKSGELSEGIFVVGEDIAPGMYKFSNNKEDISAQVLVLPSMEVYDASKLVEPFVFLKTIQFEYDYIKESDWKYYRLEEGNVVIVSRGRVKVESVINTLSP